MEGVRHFALILEDVDAAAGRYFAWKLRLGPADVQGGHYMEKQVRGDTPRVVPILAETEEAVGVEGPLGRLAQPHLPVDIVLVLPIRAGSFVDIPVPFAFFGITVIGTLAHDHL